MNVTLSVTISEETIKSIEMIEANVRGIDMEQKKTKIQMRSLGIILFSFFISSFMLENLRITVNCTTFSLAVIAIYALFSVKFRFELDKRRKFLLIIFVLLLSLANNLGSHIHIGQSPYTDLRDQSYLTKYGWSDAVGIPAMIIVFYQGMKQLLYWMPRGVEFCKKKGLLKSRQIRFWIPMAIFVVCWVPYLILYYPGFIFGDSITSIKQAVGLWEYSNHHPFMYTLFIKLCIAIGMHSGNLSLGIAIYSCIQIIYIAFAVSKLMEWLSRHRCPFVINCFFIGFYAVMPFFGQISVAVWKDPGFGASVVLWTLCILNFLECAKTEKKKDEKKYFVFGILATLLVCFLRNNGAYALLFFMMVLCVEFVLHREELKKIFFKMLLSSLLVISIYFVVTGPIYNHFHIASSSIAESVGIPLNQMASVAASQDGVMSEEDKEFINNLLPIGLYSETYRPCCVDLLKWNENFNGDYLNDHIGDFLKTYVSVGLKNPAKYVDSWAMMTFGYWNPNWWEFCNDADNLGRGNFGDLANSGLDIQQVDQNNLPDTVFYKLFPNRGTVVPLALVDWMAFFAVALAILAMDFRTVLALAPSIGIIATLLIASPYYYWPRYGMAQFYLMPLYLYLAVFCMMQCDRKRELQKS